MPPVIRWTQANERDEPLPGHVTRLVSLDGQIVVEFSGNDEYGARYEGILRLALNLQHQEVAGTYRLETSPNAWEDINFTVRGRFQDRAFSTFEGEWREPEGTCYIGLYDLPPPQKQRRTTGSHTNRNR